MDKEKIVNLINGIKFNIDRINCILRNKFEFEGLIDYKPNVYDHCTAPKEEEKIYLSELIMGLHSQTTELGKYFKRLI